MLVSFVIAIAGSILITIFGKAIYHPHWPVYIGPLIAAFILGTICFSCFGFFLGAILPTSRAAQGVGMLLFFIMMILGGAGPPPKSFPGRCRLSGT